MSCRVVAFVSERNDGHALSAGHALLLRVEHKESTRCLCSIALFSAEVGMSRTVSAPRPERHLPRAAQCSCSQFAICQFVSRHTSHLLHEFYTCGRGDGQDIDISCDVIISSSAVQ